MGQKASSFEKKKIMSMPYFHTVSISVSYVNTFSQGLVLPNQLLFQFIFFPCLLLGLQFKGSHRVFGDRVLFRFVSDRLLPRVVGPPYSPLSLKIYF